MPSPTNQPWVVLCQKQHQQKTCCTLLLLKTNIVVSYRKKQKSKGGEIKVSETDVMK